LEARRTRAVNEKPVMSGRAGDDMDRRRFLELVEEHRHALYRFARNWLRDVASAEDVVQDTYVSALKSYSTLDPPRDVRAWLFTILIRRVLTHNRSFKRQLDRVELREDMDVLATLERQESYESVLDDPARFLEASSDQLRQAIERLTTSQRSVFWLRTVEGFSFQEISKLLGIPVGTATSHATRARERLRSELADYALEIGFVKNKD
jgi:RNA polymerase sigma-70 factor (ECF subfamily)